MVLFLMKSSKGDQQKERVRWKKKHISIKQTVSLWRAASREKRGLCVKGSNAPYRWQACLPDAIPLAPPLTPAKSTHTHRSNAQPPNQHTKSEKLKWKTEEKPEEPRRKWDVSKMKVTGIGWKWKYVVMQPAHKQFGSMSGEFKGNSDKSGAE